MMKMLRNALIVAMALMGLLMLFYPLLIGNAQKAPDRKSSQKNDALAIVRQNIVANVFYESLTASESGWTLKRAINISDGQVITTRGVETGPNRIEIFLQKDKSEAQVIISEYPTADAAKLPLSTEWVSQGRAEDCRGQECGDEGRRLYGLNGKDFALTFRRDRFLISIYQTSEETAKRLAGIAIAAVSNK